MSSLLITSTKFWEVKELNKAMLKKTKQTKTKHYYGRLNAKVCLLSTHFQGSGNAHLSLHLNVFLCGHLEKFFQWFHTH